MGAAGERGASPAGGEGEQAVKSKRIEMAVLPRGDASWPSHVPASFSSCREAETAAVPAVWGFQRAAAWAAKHSYCILAVLPGVGVMCWVQTECHS